MNSKAWHLGWSVFGAFATVYWLYCESWLMAAIAAGFTAHDCYLFFNEPTKDKDEWL